MPEENNGDQRDGFKHALISTLKVFGMVVVVLLLLVVVAFGLLVGFCAINSRL